MLPFGGPVKVRGLFWLFLAFWLIGSRAGAQQVAVTFDDLPAHGDLPPGVTRTDVAKKILATLKAYHVKQAYGFINAKNLENTPQNREVLNLWIEAGQPLGNHAYSHMDLAAHSAEEFESD